MSAPLTGHPAPDELLSPRRAFADLPGRVRAVVDYAPRSRWERDTELLPRALARYRRELRRFAETELAPRALAGDLDPHGPAAAAVLRAGARAGLLTDGLPRPLGSLSWPLARQPMSWLHAVKMEELCAACAGLGLVLGAHVLGTMPLLAAGSWRTIRRCVLPAYRRTRAGRPHVFAFAITEPAAGSDVEEGHGASLYRPGTIARRVCGGWRLRGRKVFISGGDIADGITVFAALEGEGMASWTCFLVERGSPGFRVARTELKMGQRASAAAELELDDVFVPDERVVGGLRRGWAINRATLNFSRIPVGAIAVGIARGATDAAIRFASGNRLAGRALIHYQEVQLALAQMIADTATMRALVWHCARRFTPLQGEAALTKFQCADTAVRVCEQAMDLLGNHAVAHANRVEKQYRDARLTQIYEGTNQINRLALIEDLQEELLQQAGATRSGRTS